MSLFERSSARGTVHCASSPYTASRSFLDPEYVLWLVCFTDPGILPPGYSGVCTVLFVLVGSFYPLFCTLLSLFSLFLSSPFVIDNHHLIIDPALSPCSYRLIRPISLAFKLPFSMPLKVLSLNVQGLNSPHKRTKAFRYFTSSRADVVCLQETHFSVQSCPKFFHRQYQQCFMSNFSRKSRGTFIGFKKSAHFTCTNCITDPEGRYTIVTGSLGDSDVTVVSYYAPNQAQIQFMSKLFAIISRVRKGLLLVCGDSNAVLFPHIDRSSHLSSPPYNCKKFRDLLATQGMTDIWRELHPSTHDFSHYSHPHNVHTRIDHIFLPFQHINLASSSKLHPVPWSDHSAVSLLLSSLSYPTTRPSWRLHESSLADVSTCNFIEANLADYFRLNDTPDVSPTSIWEAHKPVLRGRLMQLVASTRAQHRARLDSLETKFLEHNAQFSANPTPSNRRLLNDTRCQLNLLLDEGTGRQLFRTSHIFYDKKNKPDSMLATKLRNIHTPYKPLRLHTDRGNITSNPHRITEIFRQHLSSLYSAPPSPSPSSLSSFIDHLNLPSLTVAQQEIMDAPITISEVTRTIASLKLNKTPGPDGLPALYYRKFSDILAPYLMTSFNSLLHGSSLSPTALTASVCMIPKPNTDSTNCANFRPISLINTDIKILTKTLARRLNPIIGSLVHHDQVGFIPTRQAGDSIRRVVLLTDYAQRHKLPSILLSIDITKAFDSVSWPYLQYVLQSRGFGPHFRTWFSALYSSPTAHVTYAGYQSSPFPIFRGTRQGCPLSPLLFALAMEPLAHAIRLQPDISGITVGDITHKISLFADDALLFLTNPTVTLPNLLPLLSSFSTVSGLSINESKSTVLNLNLPSTQSLALKQSLPFHWSDSTLKYLGITLTTSFDSLYDANYPPLFLKLHRSLALWQSYHLSWFGRIAAIRMTLLPKLLYFFRVLPIHIPIPSLRRIHSAILTFIWGNSRPRVAWQILNRKRDQGGLSLPNIMHYYRASRIAQSILYNAQDNPPLWVSIEAHEIQPISIANILWLPPKFRPPDLNPITRVSLTIWDSCNTKYRLTSPCPPLLSFLGNPAFPSGIFDPAAYKFWTSAHMTTIRTLISHDSMVPFTVLRSQHNFPPSEIFRYLQVTSFVTSFLLPHSSRNPTSALTPLEKRCLEAPFAAGAISLLYQIFCTSAQTDLPLFTRRWISDLSLDLDPSVWPSIWRSLNLGINSVRHKEVNYKVLARWYMVPSRLHAISPTLPKECFRGCSSPGSHAHIWWYCPLVQRFWRKIFHIATVVCKRTISPDPALALFHYDQQHIPKTQLTFLRFLFTNAKLEIASKWLSPKLSLDKVKHNLHWTMAMERRSAQLLDRLPYFQKVWSDWVHYFTPSPLPS